MAIPTRKHSLGSLDRAGWGEKDANFLLLFEYLFLKGCQSCQWARTAAVEREVGRGAQWENPLRVWGGSWSTVYPIHLPGNTFLTVSHVIICRWWTSMSLYQKCQTHLTLSWSSTQVSTTCSLTSSRSDNPKLSSPFITLLQVCHSTANVGSPGVGINMVRRLLRDTLAI